MLPVSGKGCFYILFVIREIPRGRKMEAVLLLPLILFTQH